MSGGVLYQSCLRVLSRSGLDDLAQRDVLRALEAARNGGPLDLLYDCGAEAGLEREVLLSRGAAIFFSFAAGNLADDIADGECTYLEEPVRTGPCVQFILQNLFFSTAAGAAVTPTVLQSVAADLARAAGPQLLEVRTREWTAEGTRRVAEAIAGLQYCAYLRLLWAGTALEACAPSVGIALGVACHVARDLATSDPRMATLSPTHALEIVTWAREQADVLRKENLACLNATLRHLDPILTPAS